MNHDLSFPTFFFNIPHIFFRGDAFFFSLVFFFTVCVPLELMVAE